MPKWKIKLQQVNKLQVDSDIKPAMQLSAAAKPIIPKHFYLAKQESNTNTEMFITDKLPGMKISNGWCISDEVLEVICTERKDIQFLKSIAIDGVDINWVRFSRFLASIKFPLQLRLTNLILTRNAISTVEQIICQLPKNSIVLVNSVALIEQEKTECNSIKAAIGKADNLSAVQIDEHFEIMLDQNLKPDLVKQAARIIQVRTSGIKKICITSKEIYEITATEFEMIFETLQNNLDVEQVVFKNILFTRISTSRILEDVARVSCKVDLNIADCGLSKQILATIALFQGTNNKSAVYNKEIAKDLVNTIRKPVVKTNYAQVYVEKKITPITSMPAEAENIKSKSATAVIPLEEVTWRQAAKAVKPWPDLTAYFASKFIFYYPVKDDIQDTSENLNDKSELNKDFDATIEAVANFVIS